MSELLHCYSSLLLVHIHGKIVDMRKEINCILLYYVHRQDVHWKKLCTICSSF